MSIPAIALGAAQLAVSVGSAVAGVKRAENAYQRDELRHEQNKEAAEDAYILKTHLSTKRMREDAKSISQRKSDNSIKRMQAEATATVAAASGGVQGASVEQILDDFTRSEGIVNDRLDQSMEAREQQAHYEMLGYGAEATRRVQNIPMPTMDGIYAASIQGVAGVVNAASDFGDLYAGEYND